MSIEDEISGFASFIQKSEDFKSFVDSVSKPYAELERVFANFNFGKTLEDTLNSLSPDVQNAVLELGSNGWYFSPNMAIKGTITLANELKNGNPNAEPALEQYFEDRLDKIEEGIVKEFPDRATIVACAFRAHRQEDYILSIPVFIAQADGICINKAGGSLFMTSKIKKDGSPQTADYVDQLAGSALMNALLSPLTKRLPISSYVSPSITVVGHLNRHAVMHGLSLDYGTKTNSLKAISLLNYVAEMLS